MSYKGPARRRLQEESVSVDSEWTIARQARNRMNSFRKVIHSIKFLTSQKPFLFFSLSYAPKEARKVSASRLRSDINKLARHLRYRYPKGWFIYVVEFSEKSGFHIHLLGSSGGDKGLTRKEAHKDIAPVWARLAKSKRKNLAHVRVLRNGKAVLTRRGYLLKRKKFSGWMKVAKRFGKIRNFGIISNDNCIRYPKRSFILPEEYERFFHALILQEVMPKDWRPNIDDLWYVYRVLNYGCGLHVIKNRKFIANCLSKLELLAQEEDE